MGGDNRSAPDLIDVRVPCSPNADATGVSNATATHRVSIATVCLVVRSGMFSDACVSFVASNLAPSAVVVDVLAVASQ